MKAKFTLLLGGFGNANVGKSFEKNSTLNLFYISNLNEMPKKCMLLTCG